MTDSDAANSSNNMTVCTTCSSSGSIRTSSNSAKVNIIKLNSIIKQLHLIALDRTTGWRSSNCGRWRSIAPEKSSFNVARFSFDSVRLTPGDGTGRDLCSVNLVYSTI